MDSSLIDDPFGLDDATSAYSNPLATSAVPTTDSGFSSFISNLFSTATTLGKAALTTQTSTAQTAKTATTSTNSWLIFGAIAGGVLLLIVVLFFAVRRH